MDYLRKYKIPFPLHTSPPPAQGVVFAGVLGEPEASIGISGVRLPTASTLHPPTLPQGFGGPGR